MQLTNTPHLQLIVACVGQTGIKEQLAQMAQDHGQLSLIELKTESNWRGLSCCYKNPQLMGVDRWMAMIGAWFTHNNPCLVIDCGTAITVDAIDEKGQHLGGHIVPGLNLMHQSLLTNTAKVPLGYHNLVDMELGFADSTSAAVGKGCSTLVVDYIKSQWHQFCAHYSEAKLVITGGDGLSLAKLAQLEKNYCPHLVFEGMKIRTEEVDNLNSG